MCASFEGHIHTLSIFTLVLRVLGLGFRMPNPFRPSHGARARSFRARSSPERERGHGLGLNGTAENDAPLTDCHVCTNCDEIRIVKQELAPSDGSGVRAKAATHRALVTRVLEDAQNASAIAHRNARARVGTVATSDVIAEGNIWDYSLHGPTHRRGPGEPVNVAQVLRKLDLRPIRHFPE